MADFNNITGGLNITSQIPLDVKKFKINEAALADLGLNYNLAFTYYEGLKVYCFQEKTTYIWKEVPTGEENTGLLTSDFVYPDNLVAFGIIYSNKRYNFFKEIKGFSLNNTGTGVSIYSGANININGNSTDYNLRKLNSENLGTNGFSLFGGFNENPNDISLLIRLINSNSLTLNIGENGELNINLPSSSIIPGLYVNNNYIPSYDEFLSGITKGTGSLSKPFTDTVTYSDPVTRVITPNTAIQNALDVYVGDLGTYSRTNPQLSGQRIIIQDNVIGYTFDGDFSYSNINIINQGYITSTTIDYLINMDNPLYFNSISDGARIENDGAIITKGKGYLCSGNLIATTTYATLKQLQLRGRGSYQDLENFSGNTKYLLNSDPTGSLNGTTGCNNDGHLAISVEDCIIYSKNNGIVKIGGKSRIEFKNSNITSSDTVLTVDPSLIAFDQSGGWIRAYDCRIYLLGGSRVTGFKFSPTSNFQNSTLFLIKNNRFSGNCEKWFDKTTIYTLDFDLTNCNSLYFSGTQLFDSVNLWNVKFNGNIFDYIGIDFTKVDFTGGNGRSSVNTIGSNIIEQLLKFGKRGGPGDPGGAYDYIPIGSVFINTNGMPITTSHPSWKRDIVI